MPSSNMLPNERAKKTEMSTPTTTSKKGILNTQYYTATHTYDIHINKLIKIIARARDFAYVIHLVHNLIYHYYPYLLACCRCRCRSRRRPVTYAPYVHEYRRTDTRTHGRECISNQKETHDGSIVRASGTGEREYVIKTKNSDSNKNNKNK